jgi:hypothetical protein
MKTRTVVAALACAVLFVATLAAADVQLKGVKCLLNPKAGAKAEQSVEYKEGKVFFCCGNCLKKFKGDTAKFAGAANSQLVATKQYKQKACPLTGGKLNPTTAIKVGAVKVAFCCNNCKGKAEKASGDDQLQLVFSDKAFKKGFEVAKKKAAKKKE